MLLQAAMVLALMPALLHGQSYQTSAGPPVAPQGDTSPTTPQNYGGGGGGIIQPQGGSIYVKAGVTPQAPLPQDSTSYGQNRDEQPILPQGNPQGSTYPMGSRPFDAGLMDGPAASPPSTVLLRPDPRDLSFDDIDDYYDGPWDTTYDTFFDPRSHRRHRRHHRRGRFSRGQFSRRRSGRGSFR